jgi:hypothetical protein
VNCTKDPFRDGRASRSEFSDNPVSRENDLVSSMRGGAASSKTRCALGEDVLYGSADTPSTDSSERDRRDWLSGPRFKRQLGDTPRAGSGNPLDNRRAARLVRGYFSDCCIFLCAELCLGSGYRSPTVAGGRLMAAGSVGLAGGAVAIDFAHH